MFATTNATGSDNDTLLTAPSGGAAGGSPALPGARSTNTSGPLRSTTTSNYTSNGTSNGSPAPPLPPAEVLLLPQVRPQYVVPLKVIMGISSSFITNAAQPGGQLTRELTGTETLRCVREGRLCGQS